MNSVYDSDSTIFASKLSLDFFGFAWDDPHLLFFFCQHSCCLTTICKAWFPSSSAISPFPGSELDWTFRPRSSASRKHNLDLFLWPYTYMRLRFIPNVFNVSTVFHSSSGNLICVGTALVHGGDVSDISRPTTTVDLRLLLFLNQLPGRVFLSFC